MKLRNLLYIMICAFLSSAFLNLYFNMQINVLSIELEEIKNEIVELEVEKSQSQLMHIEAFSINNIEKISREINFKRLDVRNKRLDLVLPYKLAEDMSPISVLGFEK